MVSKESSFKLNKKIELMRQILKKRIENDLSLIEKYRERPVPKVDDLPEIVLMGLPEGTIVSIVETYWVLKKKTMATDQEIFEAIEKHRSILFPKSTISQLPLTLSSYIKYRLSIEHAQGFPLSNEFVDEAIDVANRSYR